MSSEDTKSVVAFGEALWDCLPRGLFLGGAPFNVAYHASRFGAVAAPATSVGRDFLGDQILDRARVANLDTALISRHPFLQTGVAIAELDGSGNARYDIRQPSAWDDIQLDDAQIARAQDADAFVYGTLAARSEVNRALLNRLLAGGSKFALCDVNLRPPFDDLERARALARRADLVKLNEDELYALADVSPEDLALPAALERCQEVIGVDRICVTLGGDGAMAWDRGEILRVASPKVTVADTIGAGDAFTAALVMSLLSGIGMGESLKRAVRLGAYVASQNGAQPDYKPEEVFSADAT